jgi:DNA-binding NtrC family response regulator
VSPEFATALADLFFLASQGHVPLEELQAFIAAHRPPHVQITPTYPPEMTRHATDPAAPHTIRPLQTAMEEKEREIIETALHDAKSDALEAARLLRIEPAELEQRMAFLKIRLT